MNDVESELIENSKTIIIGDVNLDRNADNKESKEYVTLLKCYDYDITNCMKTRNESNRIIDHLSINFIYKTNVRNFTIHNRISDHNAVITELSDIKNLKMSTVIEKEQTNCIKFKECFETLSFQSSILNMRDPNGIAEELTRITKQAIKKSTKKIRLRCNKDVKICKWYSAKILKAIKHKDHLSRMCRKRPT